MKSLRRDGWLGPLDTRYFFFQIIPSRKRENEIEKIDKRIMIPRFFFPIIKKKKESRTEAGNSSGHSTTRLRFTMYLCSFGVTVLIKYPTIFSTFWDGKVFFLIGVGEKSFYLYIFCFEGIYLFEKNSPRTHGLASFQVPNTPSPSGFYDRSYGSKRHSVSRSSKTPINVSHLRTPVHV